MGILSHHERRDIHVPDTSIAAYHFFLRRPVALTARRTVCECQKSASSGNELGSVTRDT